jgi:hypothetical protein
MRITSLIATTTCGLALLVGPSLAAGDPPPGSPSGDHSQAGSHPAATQTPTTATPTIETPPGPSASTETKTKAYGKHCQGQSKKHVSGQKATPFSQCVTAMAKVATGKANPTTACKTLSKKHVAGQKGTPYSRCVVAAAQLHKQQQDDAPAGSSS